ncbi:TPA: hypothetical protein ACSREK_000648 [Clostridioides difficile]|uniref:hypothetical protein n=1 Tax=Clostridioides difficile TaxID=1496 RepID=UPI0021CEF9B3|nr:hypothetical protein [Clostridioides difficile]MCU5873382.1 hypothetical protein [Clostridioides difficile]MCU5897151.1 hypothetical protein [Clostridioides difficile]
MDKFYICSSEGLEEVKTYTITDEHIGLYKDNLMRFRDTDFFEIDKDELGRILSNDNIFTAYIISADKEDVIKIWNEYVKTEIKNLNKRLEMCVDFIITK